jgi:uncharacterized membrane protein
MNRTEFLEALRKNLSHLPATEAEEIIRDQDEYIRDAVRSGRSEEEVVKGLGDPSNFAGSLSAEAKIEKAEQATTIRQQSKSAFSAALALIVLAPLNLIFVLGPFIGVCGILVGGWALSGGILIASVAVLGAFIVKGMFFTVGVMAMISSLFFLLGIIGLSALGAIVMLKMTEVFLTGTIAYLRWNLNFVRGRV